MIGTALDQGNDNDKKKIDHINVKEIKKEKNLEKRKSKIDAKLSMLEEKTEKNIATKKHINKTVKLKKKLNKIENKQESKDLQAAEKILKELEQKTNVGKNPEMSNNIRKVKESLNELQKAVKEQQELEKTTTNKKELISKKNEEIKKTATGIKKQLKSLVNRNLQTQNNIIAASTRVENDIEEGAKQGGISGMFFKAAKRILNE